MTRILLAEDDDALRRMIRAILELDRYEVFAFPNGQLALQAFEQINPDLVVSDISMPIMNGFELLEARAQTAFRVSRAVLVPFRAFGA